ncbi:MAG: hypothetical protein HQL17_07640 [Candidatus Omnitrophica bacterium]|nr:hypothetical protein [Candidatus Omnitrophota bacterium]
MAENFQFWSEGFKFIGFVFVIVTVPCVAVAVLGTRLINHIGQYPTKSAKLQVGICLQLLAIEIVTFFMLALFFKIFSD